LQKVNTPKGTPTAPEHKFLEERRYDNNENLRAMSMSNLINEMHTLRESLCGDEDFDTRSGITSVKNLKQREVSASKLLAVQIEIGRRLKAPRKL
jgi:hypothetical protein